MARRPAPVCWRVQSLALTDLVLENNAVCKFDFLRCSSPRCGECAETRAYRSYAITRLKGLQSFNGQPITAVGAALFPAVP